MKVQSGFDDLDVLPDVHIAQENVDRIGHRNGAVPELIIIVFEAGGPML